MPSQWCKADPSIERVSRDGVAFPLGVYPVEQLSPLPGYALLFEKADGEEPGDWEEWPDRYVFDIVISSERMPALFRTLAGLLPPRLYPILDVLGHDAYREIDPYISNRLLGLDALLESVNRFADYFFEDGLCGFGAMCDDPFVYLFVDEHKILTVRCEPDLKPKVEAALKAFDLAERPDATGADQAAHEHRSVLVTPEQDPQMMAGEEIVENLLDDWQLVLNVDTERNIDSRGRELGVTPWRCFVRLDPDPASVPSETPTGDRPLPKYAEVWLTAGSYRQAAELASDSILSVCDSENTLPPLVIAADRMLADDFLEELGERIGAPRRRDLGRPKIWNTQLLSS